MTDTQTIETAHGTIEYDTKRCANCETEVVTDEAVSVVLGGEVDKVYSTLGKIDLEGHEIRASHLCPYCAESVFDYDGPGTIIEQRPIRLYRIGSWFSSVGFWVFMTILFAVFLALQVGALVGVF
jgi:ribosomal protein S27AE